MPSVFGYDDVGDQRLGWQAAFNEPCRRRSLNDAREFVDARAIADPASVFRPPRDDYPILRRDPVEPFGTILADLVQGAAATWTAQARRSYDDFLARQMRREMAAVDTALPCTRRFQHRAGLLTGGLAGSDRALKVFEAEIELVLAQLFGLAPEVIAPELAQHVR